MIKLLTYILIYSMLMRGRIRVTFKRHSCCFLLRASMILACSFYIGQVTGLQVDTSSNQWPVFPRRNLASLAREGYLKGVGAGNKRSISTLAKNGQLPTFRSPYGEAVKDDPDDEASQEKRDFSGFYDLPSYVAYKRNIQALARDGHRFGRGSQQNEKRNIQALARNGYIHKRNLLSGDEYYYPFYQNPVPPLTEMDGPIDFNEMYDFQQSINPDMLPPLSQVFKRSGLGYVPDYNSKVEYDANLNLKRGSVGLPALGLYRPVYIDHGSNVRNKRSIYSIPDVLDSNDIDIPDDYDENGDKRSVDIDEAFRENFEKRHIGSLARLGLLPSFRFSGGRYSRSGRARLMLPSQELYRKYSSDPNFGFREYISDNEANTSFDSDDADLSSPTVSAHTHPTGRYLHRPLKNDLPNIPVHQHKPTEPYDKNRWQGNYNPNPKYYYFRSLKIPYHESDKRYLAHPAVDKVMWPKWSRNASLPSRRKNQ